MSAYSDIFPIADRTWKTNEHGWKDAVHTCSIKFICKGNSHAAAVTGHFWNTFTILKKTLMLLKKHCYSQNLSFVYLFQKIYE